MVGWLDVQPGLRPGRPEAVRLFGLTLLRVPLPPEAGGWRTRRVLKALGRRDVRRVLLPRDFQCWAALNRTGLAAVEPLGLCRAMAPRLAEALLEPIPPRQRAVLLRGRGSSAALLPPLAEALCPMTAALMADTDRGFEALAAGLSQRSGLTLLRPSQGPPPQVTVELSPGPEGPGTCLRLWGRPDLAGLSLRPDLPEPPRGADSLALAGLLWETGRLKMGQIQVVRPGVPLDIEGKRSYNS